MITPFETYCSFRRAQARVLNRPYKLPKDFNNYVATKMTKTNYDNLEKVTNAFNTRWHNIDPDRYFEYGFELFKTFSYTMFFNPKLIAYYIEKDKNVKRETGQVKKNITTSAKFVKTWLKDKKLRNDVSKLTQYCHMEIDGIKAPIKHFIINGIDKYFLVWLLFKRTLTVTPEEEGLIPLVIQNYRTYLNDVYKIDKFLTLLEKQI
jgi:hypothetical protein